MTRYMFAVIAVAFAAQASATDVVLREFEVHPMVQLESPRPGTAALAPAVDALRASPAAVVPQKFAIYPVAGVLGTDLNIPYFVDLDSTAGERDFNCTDYTFDGHAGHDPYIRSFREQEIGVPVFAPLDGLVLQTHDGEPDQNTVAVPGTPANYVVISHQPGHTTEYFHLKRGSISVTPGQRITAGTQIAMVGSSGWSAAPHVHFETRVDGVPVEPLSGPCRAGDHLFVDPPAASIAPVVIGAAFSTDSFSKYRIAPFDDAPRTGTYALGMQRVNFKVELANVRAGSTYQLSVESPAGMSSPISSGTLTAHEAYMASADWGVDIYLNQAGTWTMRLKVNGHDAALVPFTVVNSMNEIVNRPPAPITVAIEPVGLRGGEVPVCRVTGALLGDPDTDVVSYRYEWTVDSAVVRNVTSAARSDALGRQFVRGGASLSCSVTPSDGRLNGTTVSAFATAGGSRRRAVAHD